MPLGTGKRLSLSLWIQFAGPGLVPGFLGQFHCAQIDSSPVLVTIDAIIKHANRIGIIFLYCSGFFCFVDEV